MNIDDCAGGPCQNGATCTDGVNGSPFTGFEPAHQFVNYPTLYWACNSGNGAHIGFNTIGLAASWTSSDPSESLEAYVR